MKQKLNKVINWWNCKIKKKYSKSVKLREVNGTNYVEAKHCIYCGHKDERILINKRLF